MTSSLSYRPEIDGLRCFAVLPVILFHLNKELLPGGYLGVDVFFVISGFLITSILVREMDRGQFSLLSFWDRRIRRILPAASVVIVVTSIVHAALFYHPDLWGFSMQKLAALFSFANIYFLVETGSYWNPLSESSPYLHYWSLSVEEQYYLLYPILLLVLFRYYKKGLFTVVLSTVAVSFISYMIGRSFYPEETFYLLPMRAWELGAGCLLALRRDQLKFLSAAVGTALGLTLILLIYLFSDVLPLAGLDTIFVVIGTGLVIASSKNKVSGWVLENRVAVYLGRLSFSLYLWHWPVIVSVTMFPAPEAIKWSLAWVLGITLICSVLSYHFIEKPIRRHRGASPYVLLWVTIVGVFLLVEKPFLLRGDYLTKYFDTPIWSGLKYDLRPIEDLNRDMEGVIDNVVTLPREAPPNSYLKGGYIREHGEQTPKVVVLGDSHAVMWAKLIDEVTTEIGVTTSFWAMNGQNPFIQLPIKEEQKSNYMSGKEKAAYDRIRLEFIKTWKPELVIVASRWEFIDPATTVDLFRFLEEHARHVLILESPPVLAGVGDRNFANYSAYLGVYPHDGGDFVWKDYYLGWTKKTRSKLEEYVQTYDNFGFLPLADIYALETGILCGNDRTVYYLDDDHLNDAGVVFARERFQLAINQALSGAFEVYPIVTSNSETSVATLEKMALPRWRTNLGE